MRHYSECIELSKYNIDLPVEFEVNDPQKKTASYPKKIIIAYGTASGDYWNEFSERQAENVYFPSAGNLDIGNNLFQNSNIEAALVLKNPANRECVEYDKPESKIIMEDLRKIKWNIGKTWGTAKTLKKFLGNEFNVHGIIYYLYMEARLTNGKVAPFAVTNDPQDDLSTTYTIKSISFNIDCLAPGTKIKMADGSEKSIENIKAGDKIDCGGNGKTAAVTNLIRSDSANTDMMAIVTEDGRSIILSFGHPVMSDKGLISANSAVEGTLLKTADNTFTRTLTGCMNSGKFAELYNLELEGDCRTMIANGFIVGDFAAEIKVKEKEADIRARIAPELLKDYDGFAALEKQK
jgi:hypothetical protein